MIDLPPPVRIMAAMGQRAEAADYTQAGITQPVKIRFRRNRDPVRSERPCLTLIFVSDEVRGNDFQHTLDEVVHELVLDVQADIEMKPEDGGEDPTGLADLLRLITVFTKSLRDEEYQRFLGGMVDWISIEGLEPEDRSTADDGRMTRALRVLYRTRSDDENVLLAAGENV